MALISFEEAFSRTDDSVATAKAKATAIAPDDGVVWTEIFTNVGEAFAVSASESFAAFDWF